ncbi:MAG: hypothetical protein LC708_04490, partial [Actinobacteria bacterium]|nr:hypothetical protein [Actinomycetota bacterium]
PRPLTDVATQCSASETDVTGSTTLTNGWLYTDSGWYDGDTLYPEAAADAGGLAEHDPVKVALATNPELGATYTGHIHLAADSTDDYRVVFNDQTSNPDGSLTVNAVHQYLGTNPPDVLTGQLVLGQATCGAPATVGVALAPVADFDGDADTDRSVFRDGAWYAEGQAPAYFGLAGDIAVPADYDGDRDTDRAVYRGGAWYTDGAPTVYLGVSGDIPVPGDYDGNGTTDRAVFRPSVGAWYVEGKAPVFHGATGDIAVPGDYDGNGTTDVAIWRPSVGGWYVAGQPTVFVGLDGDIPVPGDYDGNGTTDRGIWRPAVGGWYIEGQTTAFVGLSGD